MEKNSRIVKFLVLKFLSFLKFQVRLDLVIVDRPGKNKRFQRVYFLRSLQYNSVFLCEEQVSLYQFLPSLDNLFYFSKILEYESWNRFGVRNSKLNERYLLTDYGFKNFPLRKDFPIIGFYEHKYCDVFKVLKESDVTIRQQYRIFTNVLDSEITVVGLEEGINSIVLEFEITNLDDIGRNEGLEEEFFFINCEEYIIDDRRDWGIYLL
jgi:NADH:ubiquinone oxidoreductase subunit C